MAELKRVLGLNTALLITINSIIGSGLFFLPAIAAYYSGPASILAWIIVSIIALATAVYFSELVAMFPTAGGIYEFSKKAYGRFSSFLIGWLAWLVSNITVAMLVVGAIHYLLPYTTPFFITFKIVICLIWVVIFNTMAYHGIKTSAVMLVTFAIITIMIILVLIFPSLPHFRISNFTPFFVHKGIISNITHLFLTVFFISEAFFGLESVTFLAEETKRPEKVLPRALIFGTMIISFLTIALVTVTLGAIHHNLLGVMLTPFADLAYLTMGTLGKKIITIGTYLVIIGAAAGWVVTGPRLLLALTRDKLFIPQLGKIHPKYHSPYRAIVFQAVISSIFVVISFKGDGYKTLLSLLVPLVLVMISAVILTVPILRKKRPHVKRPFMAPFPRIGPALIVIFNAFLIILWIIKEESSIRLVYIASSFMFVAVPVYLLLEMYYDPKMIRKANNVLAYLVLFTERIALPARVREKILSSLGDIRRKRVLEFGCSVGTLTTYLAKAVGGSGKVYATDISEKHIKIARNRIHSLGHTHVMIIHDELHAFRVHPSIPKVDVVVSVATLGYLRNARRVLKDINKRLKIGSRICFLDYDKFFDIIPNIEWLSNDAKIRHIFRECGFAVTVEREKGLLWQYIFIHGRKVKNV